MENEMLSSLYPSPVSIWADAVTIHFMSSASMKIQGSTPFPVRLEIVVVRLGTVLRMEDDAICNHRSLLAIHGHHQYCCRDNGDNSHTDDGESFPPRYIM